ncbi:hypothetical protein [Streptomyces sp. SLBN-8D4]|uniref:hypothetical protein n=1 Tax=Streptomyces sp. SLBN-8D4 TaxID=3377728 RepID=UPI003C7C7F13
MTLPIADGNPHVRGRRAAGFGTATRATAIRNVTSVWRKIWQDLTDLQRERMKQLGIAPLPRRDVAALAHHTTGLLQQLALLGLDWAA